MKEMVLFDTAALVDEAAARDWYARRAEDWDCDCLRCRNYLALARSQRLPQELLRLLDGFGLPPEKADYICMLVRPDNWRERGCPYQIMFRLPGQMLREHDPETPWPWAAFEGDRHEPYYGDDFPKPFIALNIVLELPWVLEEAPDPDLEISSLGWDKP